MGGAQSAPLQAQVERACKHNDVARLEALLAEAGPATAAAVLRQESGAGETALSCAAGAGSVDCVQAVSWMGWVGGRSFCRL